jgi:hypothetical protein
VSARFGEKTWRVEVTWEDCSIASGGWRPIRKHIARRKRVICHTVGYILAHDKRGMVLASSVNGWRAFGVVHIPASQIVKCRRLR